MSSKILSSVLMRHIEFWSKFSNFGIQLVEAICQKSSPLLFSFRAFRTRRTVYCHWSFEMLEVYSEMQPNLKLLLSIVSYGSIPACCRCLNAVSVILLTWVQCSNTFINTDTINRIEATSSQQWSESWLASGSLWRLNLSFSTINLWFKILVEIRRHSWCSQLHNFAAKFVNNLLGLSDSFMIEHKI